MKASQIIAAARECIGTPFAHQGRIINKALDCAGVAVHVFDSMGCEVDQPAAYSRTPNNAMLEYWADRQPFLTRETIPQAGDILLMRFAGEPQHVAIFTGENLIHAYEAIGRVVEHRLDAKWRKRIVRAYRFKGIEA
ncbi:MAG: NlpC/P60 family protein [Deltaproteobacteria bacterium]|nr:NlpC/P60 family protein [Thiobacillus sp.]MDP3213611.1 NlpC/P60 family protein [Deltaproteobacteria bacterium]